jgi:hypothetical protein
MLDKKKQGDKIMIIGDSHARACAGNMKHNLNISLPGDVHSPSAFKCHISPGGVHCTSCAVLSFSSYFELLLFM